MKTQAKHNGFISLFSLLWFLGFIGVHGFIAYAIVKTCYILRII